MRIGITADDLADAMDAAVPAAPFRSLAATSIRLVGEIEPGFPVGRIDARLPFGLITTVGGFGGPDAIVPSAGRLRGENIGFAA